MLPKSYRLQNKKDFERIYQKGKPFKGNFLFLKVLKNNLQHPRIGAVVSRKTASKASQRNLIKRRIREAVRPKLALIKENIDIIIVAGRSINKKTSFQMIDKDLKELFLKAEIIKTNKKTDKK